VFFNISLGVSELSKAGACLGQLLIKDLDTPGQSGPLQALLYSAEGGAIVEADHRLAAHVNLTPSERLLFTSLAYPNDSQASEQSAQVFEVALNWAPDFEERPVHDFLLVLRDSNAAVAFESWAQLVLELDDENDHAPLFPHNYFEFTLAEWFGPSAPAPLPADTRRICLGQVQATDNDRSHAHAALTYEISDLEPVADPRDSPAALFYVEQATGLVCVHPHSLASLDRERKPLYKFRFSAVNRESTPPLRSSVLVQVALTDLNDNRPEFSLGQYTFFTPEKDSNLVASQIGRQRPRPVSVGRVLAVDRDQGLNAQVRYSLQPGAKAFLQLNTDNARNPLLPLSVQGLPLPDLAGETAPDDMRRFRAVEDAASVAFVNASSGQVYLVRQLDREQVTHVHLRVVASDRGGAQEGGEAALSSSVAVVVELIDLNDSAPECLNAGLQAAGQFALALHLDYADLQEATLVGAYPIYQLECRDWDLGKNAELTYHVERVYLRGVEAARDEGARFAFASYLGSLSGEQRRALGQVHEVSGGTPYLTQSQMFSVEPKSGLVYFNDIRSLWANNKFYQMLFFARNLLVLSVRVSDAGMLSNAASYLLTVRVCVRDEGALEQAQAKYCDWEAAAGEAKEGGRMFVTRRLDSVEEELLMSEVAVEGREEGAFTDGGEYVEEESSEVGDESLQRTTLATVVGHEAVSGGARPNLCGIVVAGGWLILKAVRACI